MEKFQTENSASGLRAKYDIIIIGSGPAGISTALHLVKIAPELKERILVLERQRHPRPKLCAGGILMDGERILKNLGLDCDAVPSIKVKQAYFHFEGGGICIELHPQSFRVIRREDFDAWLVHEARGRGITVVEETRVLNISADSQGVTVQTDQGDYRSQIIVGADGVNSVVRRAITQNQNQNQSMALEIFLPPPPAPETAAWNPNQAFFNFSVISRKVQGYIWKFPSPGNGAPACTRGIYHARVFPNISPGNLKAVLEGQLSREKVNVSDLKLNGRPIRFFDPKGFFSAPRVILVGDAAGNPVFQRLLWWRFGFLLKWYIEHWLINWAK